MNPDDPRGPSPAPDQLSDTQVLEAARRGARHLATTTPDALAHLWDGIAAAAFDDHAPDADDADHDLAGHDPADHDPADHAGADLVEARDDQPRRGLRAVPGTGTPDRGTTRRRRSRSMVHRSEARRRRTMAGGLAGIAAVVLAVLGVSWVVTHQPAPVPVATFEMDPLDDRVVDSVAGTVVDVDGGQAVEVDLAELPPAPEGSFYELWLLDLDEGRLVSLGPVGTRATFAIPPAVAAGTWPTIDVSVEPADGDPTHSSDSVLRGPVVATGPTG